MQSEAMIELTGRGAPSTTLIRVNQLEKGRPLMPGLAWQSIMCVDKVGQTYPSRAKAHPWREAAATALIDMPMPGKRCTSHLRSSVRGLTDCYDSGAGRQRHSAANAIEGFCQDFDIRVIWVAVQDLSLDVHGHETGCDRCCEAQCAVYQGSQHHHARNSTRGVSDLAID
jgi:hypothetical protein